MCNLLEIFMSVVLSIQSLEKEQQMRNTQGKQLHQYCIGPSMGEGPVHMPPTRPHTVFLKRSSPDSDSTQPRLQHSSEGVALSPSSQLHLKKILFWEGNEWHLKGEIAWTCPCDSGKRRMIQTCTLSLDSLGHRHPCAQGKPQRLTVPFLFRTATSHSLRHPSL